jgi:hypothetical protein
VNAPTPVTWSQPVPYTVHTEFSFQPVSVLGMLIPGIDPKNNAPFVGVVLLTLAGLALAGEWRQRTVRLFAGIGLGGLIFSLGTFSIFHGPLYALLPMVEKARTPAFAILVLQFSVIVLSAYGLDAGLNEAWRRRVVRALLILAASVYFVLFSFGPPQLGDPNRAALVALVALLVAGALYAWTRGHLSRRAATTSLLCLLLLEQGIVAGFQWKHRTQGTEFLDRRLQHEDVAAFLRTRPEPVRLEVDDTEVPYNFGDWYGIDVFGGYLASLTNNVFAVHANPHARMLFGVNYYLGRKPLREDQVEVFAAAGGARLYANPRAFSRAWSVHEAVQIEPAELGSRLGRPLEEHRRRAFLTVAAPRLESCGDGDVVRLLAREANRLVVEADLRCRGMVIVGETYFPGWKARVDGSPAAIYEVYGALRGVVVDGGRRRIEMVYRPMSVLAGAVLSLLAGLGAAVLALTTRGRG